MDNLVMVRMSILPAMFLAALFGYLGYRNMPFPFNFIIPAIAALAFTGYCFFINRKEKAARHDAVGAAALDFGRIVSFDNHSASFERDGTVFDTEFPKDKHNTCFKVSFYLPNIRERFIIQHRELFTKSIDGCNLVEPSPLAEGIIVRSLNADFLRNLLKNPKILNELDNYPSRFLARFLVAFDDGSFELEWSPKLNDQIDGFYQVCRTAVVFHDELKKHAKTS